MDWRRIFHTPLISLLCTVAIWRPVPAYWSGQPYLPALLPEPTWDATNCPDGNVTDFVCCADGSERCSSRNSQNECEMEKTCAWQIDRKTALATCVINRDANNNVCCKRLAADLAESASDRSSSQSCHAILNGFCPESFVVPAGCCDPQTAQFAALLQVKKPGHVCCNSPCSEMSKHNCTLTDICLKRQKTKIVKPTGRSFGFYAQPAEVATYYPASRHAFGFNPALLSAPQYHHGNLATDNDGHVEWFDYRTDVGSIVPDPRQLVASGSVTGTRSETPDQSVYEVTVDDVMRTLLDALDNDNDVFEQSAEVYGDYREGQRLEYGLVGDEYTYPDPDGYLRSFYPDIDLSGTGTSGTTDPAARVPWETDSPEHAYFMSQQMGANNMYANQYHLAQYGNHGCPGLQ